MGTTRTFEHVFVETVPTPLEAGKLYVSIKYGTSIHLCPCGCGSEIVAPLSPTDWRIVYDGETISLFPSIGNWNLPCESHYWITNNGVVWAPKWSRARIASGRSFDDWMKRSYYADRGIDLESEATDGDDTGDD